MLIMMTMSTISWRRKLLWWCDDVDIVKENVSQVDFGANLLENYLIIIHFVEEKVIVDFQ